MTPTQLQTIRDAMNYDRSYWRDTSSEPCGERDAEIAKIDDAESALNALVDSVRWRKQSDEPAPKCARVLWRDGPDNIGTIMGQHVEDTDEWLPIPHEKSNV